MVVMTTMGGIFKDVADNGECVVCKKILTIWIEHKAIGTLCHDCAERIGNNLFADINITDSIKM